MSPALFRPLSRYFLFAAASAWPVATLAGPGWYLGLEGGVNLADNQKLDTYNVEQIGDGVQIGTADFDTGWLAGLVAGYSFENGFRPEVALTHRRDSLKRVRVSTPSPYATEIDTSDVSGNDMTDTVLFNLWYEFTLFGRVRPYLGGGVGGARFDVHDTRYGSQQLRSDFTTVVAWQAGGGLVYDLGEHLTASLDYRFLQTHRGDFNLLDDVYNAYLRMSYRASSFQLGLRYSFGDKGPAPRTVVEPVAVVPVQAPPPPSPPPCELPADGRPIDLAGCKVGDVVVLNGVNFEFDKARLTLNAKTLLDQIGVALTATPDIKVEIDGHTDSKGAGPYNQKLSEVRANSVRDYLIERGIDAGRITTRGFGETMPIANNTTDDGRERNRRVELKVIEAAAPVDSGPPVPAAGGDSPEVSAAEPPIVDPLDQQPRT